MTDKLLVSEDTLKSIADTMRASLNTCDKMYITDVPGLVEILSGNSSKDICFTSKNESVIIGLKGEGQVRIYVNNALVDTVVLNEDSFTYATVPGSDDRCSLYQIDDVDCITELDLRENGIDLLEFNSYNKIIKLILMDNYISKLDLSKCKELKYLHFYNNPICDDSQCEEELRACMNSLPDRTGKSIGSILLYPWYGLETLICQVDGEYRKYPQNEWTDYKGKIHKPYNDISGNLFEPLPGSAVDNKILETKISGSAVTLISKNLSYTWLAKPIRSTNLLKGKTLTLKCDNITSSGNNIGAVALAYEKSRNTDYRILCLLTEADLTPKSVTLEYDADICMLLYVNNGGSLTISDTVTFNNIELTCDDTSYKLTQGKLYGLVENDNITYYTGESDSSLREEEVMNAHHSLRKDLEKDITLNKNWMFGSAIQYHEDYSMCYHYFKDIGVQDVWETAEKGFGACIGSIDQFRGKVKYWNDMNILAHEAKSGTGIGPYTKSGYHGDKILSHIAGRGEGVVYGICPNAQFYCINQHSNTSSEDISSWGNGAYYLGNSPCTSMTFSYSGIKSNDMRYALGKFGETNFVTESAGNGGDGVPWSYEESELNSDNSTKYTSAFGNYGTPDNKGGTSNHTNVFFVYSLAPSKEPSYFSHSSIDANVKDYAGFVPGDYLSHYGEQIACYNPETKSLGCIQGTSMSSPNCNSTLSLMRIIYQKIHPECTLFGKDSKFMEFVKNNWMDRLEDGMTFSVGLGMPSFMCEPNKIVVDSVEPSGVSFPSLCSIGDAIEVKSFVSQDCKDGITLDYRFADFAYNKGKLIPITTFDSSSVTAYTNTSIVGVGYAESDTNGPSFASNYYKDTLVMSCIEDNSDDISIIGDTDDVRIHTKDMHFEWVERGVDILGDEYEKLVQFDCVGCDSNYSGPITIQYLVKLSPEHLPVATQELKTKGVYYDNIRFLFRRTTDDTINRLAYIVYSTTYKDGVPIFSIPNKYEYIESAKRDGNGVVTYEYGESENIFVCKGSPNQSGMVAAERLRMTNGDAFVFTFTYEPGNCANIYINGSHIGKLVDDFPIGIKSNELYVLKDVVCGDPHDDVYFFNRSLSHDEILHNTISLLRKERINSVE